MSRISEYLTWCPTCKVAGIERHLGFDDELGAICCDAKEPHVFDRLPDDPPPSVESSGFAAETQNEPIQTAEEDSVRFSQLTADRKKLTVVPISTPELPAEVLDYVKKSADLTDALTGAAPQIVPSSREELAKKFASRELIPMVALGGSFQLPNGDLLLGVVIPETWSQAIIAEAEIQGAKSPAEYFARWMTSDELRSTFAESLLHYWSTVIAPAGV